MSIYSIANLATATYNIHDIVRYPSNTNYYYYCLTDNLSVNIGTSTNIPSISSSVWGGLSSFNGILKPKFIWRTNYGVVAQHEPSTLDIKFSDGYSQRIVQNINNDLLTLDVRFELRTEKEAAAIIHFLFVRQARESFLFTPSPPHDLQKLFICKEWADQYVYYNNHSITCIFEETAVIGR